MYSLFKEILEKQIGNGMDETIMSILGDIFELDDDVMSIDDFIDSQESNNVISMIRNIIAG